MMLGTSSKELNQVIGEGRSWCKFETTSLHFVLKDFGSPGVKRVLILVEIDYMNPLLPVKSVVLVRSASRDI